jgi:hypothetical protein
MNKDRVIKVKSSLGPTVEYVLARRVILVRTRTFDDDGNIINDNTLTSDGFVIGNFVDEGAVIDFLEMSGNEIVEDSDGDNH